MTNANNAERIAHDLATRPEGFADAVNKVLGARDIKEGYQSGKELMRNLIHGGGWVFPRTNTALLTAVVAEVWRHLWFSQ